MLQLVEAGYRVGQKAIVEQQSLDVPAGELLALVGPNGAGKSTLMGLLSGRLQPSSGDALLDGRPLADWSPATLARRRAVMSQNAYLAFGFSAREVVSLGRSAFASDRDSARLVEQALQLACISHLAERHFPSLSGGEQQRVQFARALVQIWGSHQEPAWLLLDEPDAGLDIAHQEIMLSVAKDFAKQGYGVAVVLHNLNLAARYADTIALVDQGRVLRQGSPWQVLEPQGLSDVYGIELQRLTSPQGNYVITPGEVSRHGAKLKLV